MSPHDPAVGAMAANPWFQSLSDRERSALVGRSVPVALKAGEMLYRVGHPTGRFYGLLAGLVKISSLNADGREAILSVLEPGIWFGEMSMVDRLPRTHDATALVDSTLLALPQAEFDLLMADAEFARSIARLLAARMRLVFGVLEDATLRSVRARVARRLLLLGHGDSELSDDARRIVSVSQDQLAMMLGVTRQTLAKEIKAMALAGAVTPGYARIELTSIDKLRGFADAAQDTTPTRKTA